MVSMSSVPRHAADHAAWIRRSFGVHIVHDFAEEVPAAKWCNSQHPPQHPKPKHPSTASVRASLR